MSSLSLKFRQKFLEKAIRFYGPFFGAGISVKDISSDYRHCKVVMPLTFYNKNYMGTQFGGSLYSMVDPWYMLMLIKNLGRDYIVWDKAAHIAFKKPGKSEVSAEFNLSQNTIDEIKRIVAEKNKTDWSFKVEIKDKSGTLIAEVDKVVYIRRKNKD